MRCKNIKMEKYLQLVEIIRVFGAKRKNDLQLSTWKSVNIM